MPIIKIPNKLYLGILSQSHLKDFEKRYRIKAEEIDSARHRPTTGVRRNPCETTDIFIEKYNQAQGSKEQGEYEDLAKEQLSRCKARAGFRCSGEGKRIDLPRAWTQLLLLRLCNGQVGNDALDVLLVSLDHSPLHPDQIPVLLNVAESVQIFLCSDKTLSERLSSYEMKMLQLGYLVSLRLFIFHLTGNLKGHQLSSVYLHHLKGLEKCESRYQDVPNMLFTLNFTQHVGNILYGLQHTEDDSEQVSVEVKEHGVNQVLQQCLLCYHCVLNNSTQLSLVIQQLVFLRDKLQQDNWADCGLGLMILGEAAKSSPLCLQTLMNLPSSQSQERSQEVTSQNVSWPWQLEHIYCSILSDICQNSQCAQMKKIALIGKSNSTGGLLSLLNQKRGEKWRLRFNAVSALSQISRRIGLQEDLRRTAWTLLQNHLIQETDARVTRAAQTTEADKSLPMEKMRGCGEGERIIGRLAHTLSHACPSAELSSHSVEQRVKTCRPRAEPTTPHTDAENARRTHRVGKTGASHLDQSARADIDLIKVVEDQWQKELKIRMEREKEIEEIEKMELEKRKQEEEATIMRKRMEKVKKYTKPYELP